MAATMKHRRSKSKRNSTRSSNRYDKLLTKFKKIKKQGGKTLAKTSTNKFVPPHTVTKDNPVYNGVKVLNTEE